jgi:Transglycosylase SLT domain
VRSIEITAPNGRTYSLNAPDEATQDQINEKARAFKEQLLADPFGMHERIYGLPEGVLQATAGIESADPWHPDGNPKAVSRTGVLGLMQITKRTGKAYGLNADNFVDPLAQIDAAAQIWRDNLKRAGGDIRRAAAMYGDVNQKDYADRFMRELGRRARTQVPPTAPVEEREEERRGLLSRAGETALRVGAPVAGGLLAGAAAPEALPFSAALGAGAASAAVSRYYRDPPREAGVQVGLAIAAPGPGKTVARSIAKGAGFGMGAAIFDDIARTGELPTKGHLALSALVGGTIGYFGKVMPEWLQRRLTSRAHIEEILPKDVAADAARVLEGKAVAGATKEEMREIRRARLNIRLQGRRGFLGKAEIEATTRPGTAPITVAEERVVRGAKGKFQKVTVTGKRELTKEDIFPEYKPTPRAERGELKRSTYATAGWSRPRILAAHAENETGVPVYSDVLRSLERVYGNREATAAEADRIIKTYLRDRSLDPAVKDIIGRFVVAAHGYEDNRELTYAMQRLGRIFGKELDSTTARRWAYNVISSPYAATIPLRPGSVMRVMAHTVQVGVMKTGWGYLARGMARTFTPGGIKEALRAGVLGAEHLSVPEEILGAGGRGWYRKALDFGFGPFRWAQDVSRATIFHATRERARDALRAVKSFEEFVDRAGLDVGIPRPEIERARFLWNQGRMGELADMVGEVHVRSYIPGHSNLDRPFVSSGVVSGQATALARGARGERSSLPRFGLQFLNWPSFYGQTMWENFRPGAGPAGKQAIMFGRLVVANAALATVAYELYGEGKEALAKTTSLIGLGPLFYSLGPGLEDVKNISRGGSEMWKGGVEIVAGDDADVGTKHVAQGFRQVGRGLPIPFKGVYGDLSDFLLGREKQ